MMKVQYGNGREAKVKPGLIDKNGMFLLMLDTNDTRYFRFSNQADLIDSLLDDNEELREKNGKLSKQVDSMQDMNAELRVREDKLTAEVIKLKEKLQEATEQSDENAEGEVVA